MSIDAFKDVPLRLDLAPKTCQYSNLISQISGSDWTELRKEVYYHSEYRCEICGGIGDKWPVECHEHWEYDDVKKIQTLKGFYCLCPLCHLAKHLGRAYYMRCQTVVFEHIQKVNQFSRVKLDKFISYEMNKQKFREGYGEWKLNIDILKNTKIDITRLMLIHS